MTDTRRLALEAVRPTKLDAVKAILGALTTAPHTPDELARALGRSVLYVRPRCSEMLKAGYVRDTGKRRRNLESGLSARVLAITLTGNLAYAEARRRETAAA